MNQIKLLDINTVNQIAAGEVLERPSNLVKELIENSLDAGATEIEIEIEHGGRFIRIRDNGKGIQSQDLPLALARHATSKISKFADIWSLNSYGFRGEALASAAAVSRLKIVSRTTDADSAAQVVSEFGSLTDVQTVGGDYGTEIIISDLFENVPARLKFLKSDTAEGTQIQKVIKAAALSRPDVHIKLKSKGQLKYYFTPTENRLQRVHQVLGFENIYETKTQDERFKTEIIFSSPNDVANTSQNIWIFIQGRWIQDRSLQKAIIDAYQNLLMHGEYPQVVLFLECDPTQIDINIHPTKSQVKFQSPGDAFRVVYHTLRKALEKAPWLAAMFKGKERGGSHTQHAFQQPHLGDSTSDHGQELGAEGHGTVVERSEIPNRVTEIMEAIHSRTLELGSDSAFQNFSFKQKSMEYSGTKAQTPSDNTISQPIFENQPYWGQLQVLGQTNLTYVLAQSNQSLFLIDQHASHERVLFEKFSNSYKNKKMETQNLLIPISVQLEAQEVEEVLKISDEFHQLGLEIEQGGPETILITTMPAMIKESVLPQAVQKTARDLVQYGGGKTLTKIFGDLFASMACHSAIRAGQSLSTAEMQELLVLMDEYPLSTFCPHGRPVFKEISFNELDREFGRIV